MHGLLKDSASVAEILEIEILRKVVLVKAVWNEFVGEHLRCRFIGILDGSDIRGIARNDADLTVRTVIFGLDRDDASHDVDHIDKTDKVHGTPPKIILMLFYHIAKRKLLPAY